MKKNVNMGFTLIEFLIAMGITAIIVMLISNALLTSSNHASLDTTVGTFMTDLKQQQLKSMVGDTQGVGVNNYYGVYFKTNSYILFNGSTYLSTNSANIIVNLPTNIIFSNINFPSSEIVFNEGSGEVQNYATTSATVTLENTNDSNTDVITINRYGVVTGI